MRVSYLRYLFEEWFDDTYLGEIQKKMSRNDIYIDEFDVSSSDGDICFPPITKPDDVTEEEMIEDIKWIKLKENHRSDLVGKILDYEYNK